MRVRSHASELRAATCSAYDIVRYPAASGVPVDETLTKRLTGSQTVEATVAGSARAWSAAIAGAHEAAVVALFVGRVIRPLASAPLARGKTDG
jgi:hypothetical protein